MKKCTALWCETNYEVKMYKAHHARSTFGSSKQVSKLRCTKHIMLGPVLEVEMMKKCTALWCETNYEVKMYKAHHARSTFGSSKQVSKLRCTKHIMLGPVLEVEMMKKFTASWCETHYEVKMYKAHHARSTFGSWDDEKVHGVVTRSTFRSQVLKTDWFWALLEVEMLKVRTPLWREAHLEVKMLEAPNV